MRHENNNMYVYAVSKIKWKETQVIRHENVIYRTYEGLYKHLKVISKTMHERFANGDGWKLPKVKYICDGGVWDSPVKMGVYLKTFDRERKKSKKNGDKRQGTLFL